MLVSLHPTLIVVRCWEPCGCGESLGGPPQSAYRCLERSGCLALQLIYFLDLVSSLTAYYPNY